MLGSLSSASAQEISAPVGNHSHLLGLGTAYVPDYAGAANSRLVPALFAEYQNEEGFFASTTRGLGKLTRHANWTSSIALSYRAGRPEHPALLYLSPTEALRGMDDISGSMTANLGASARLSDSVTLSSMASFDLKQEDNGNSLQLGISAAIWQSMHDQIELKTTLHYGDASYNQRYFGISTTQSLRSGLPAMASSAGWNRSLCSVAWTHVIDQNWSVRTLAGIQHMLNDAAESPLSKMSGNLLLISTVNYSF
ncbi:MipA/OmpV family protein [Undibacterium sp. CY7W]|uniref:MipA/OmpV family protein n=1 Tax=Undibacterium rugosum TaxID=2762291 RepID=A0A923I1R4_9BURK|nr:MipA/OmpV family protein [Undibacterium rugosum]MBC3934389.1 MipA/OmpV family protein [Undibacterium rugosum]